eukprot:m.114974 g.114974  ORF g.114974 m.114974 type:complete len:395 (+) comp10867_c0_seq2:165-1349(+)
MIPEFVADDGKVNTELLGSKLGRPVRAASVRAPGDKMGGLSGEFLFLDVDVGSGDTLSLALKRSPHSVSEHKKTLGTAREALFYAELAPSLAGANIPKAYFAQGDMATGEMIVLLERLVDTVPSGVFFGPGNPNNWDVRDKLPDLCAGNPPMEDVTRQAFSLYANLHATFWRDATLLDKPWLRGTDWVSGKGKASWQAAQQIAADGWAAMTEDRAQGTSTVHWDPHLVACLDVSFANIDWDTFQTELATRPYSLVHGDAHPHNALWVGQRTPAARLALIDFEMAGVGSPAQELGQYVISHMPPDVRRRCERDLVTGYHTALCEALCAAGRHDDAAAFTIEACWAEYIAGGVGRWAWFVPLFRRSPAMAQYFHDQLAAFLHDHVSDPATTPMPRV